MIMIKFEYLKRENLDKLPATSGVYSFFASPKRRREGRFLYIGKAINIKERVKQHKDLLGCTKQLGYIKTGSEIEALILEANLIKKYQPRFNVVWRDDKNYFFVAITKEAFPQVFITHQPFVASSPQGLRPIYKKDEGTERSEVRASYVGPFVDGKALKETLKFLRKVFPFRSCRILPQKSCLWYHLDRCPAPCVLKSRIMDVPKIRKNLENDAKKNARAILRILEGKKTKVLSELKKDMKTASKLQDFEKATKIRDRISALEGVLANARIFEKQTTFEEWSKTQEILQKITGEQTEISRIEAYDISNIQGKEAVGSMVVFINGIPDKSQYRKFKIKIAEKPNDIAMLKEILQRRSNHPEWGFPDLILIDGGKAQLNIAINSKLQNPRPTSPASELSGGRANSKQIKVLAIAKRKNELYIESKAKPIPLKTLPRKIFNLILQLRDEAHRFAISYHKKLRKKSLLP